MPHRGGSVFASICWLGCLSAAGLFKQLQVGFREIFERVNLATRNQP